MFLAIAWVAMVPAGVAGPTSAKHRHTSFGCLPTTSTPHPMLRSRLPLVVGLSLAVSASLSAQNTVNVTLTAPYAPPTQGSVTAFGYYMSPYSGTVDGTTQRFNCIDFFH